MICYCGGNRVKITNIIDIFSKIFGNLIKKNYFVLTKEIEDLSQLTEVEFVDRMRYSLTQKANSSFSYLNKLFSYFRNIDEDITYDLAIGVAAFNRCPADLPPGSELYPEQIQAAFVLTQSAVLQMDTGEGKTYAILPAAFALTRKYGKAYILCSNSYLAFRDATRTKSYWDYVGLSVSFCGSATTHDDPKWKADIIYTTLEVLAFKSLNDDLYMCDQEQRIQYDAIIIDEIDAVLLESKDTFNIGRSVKSSIYDWDRALEYVKHHIKPDHILIDWTNNTAQLTIEGIQCLRSFLEDAQIHADEFARMRKAVESSYVAINMHENNEYILKDCNIVAVNQLTGSLQYGMTYDWMIPLSILIGVHTPSSKIILHEITPKVLLNQFQHLSGMSGTAQEDMAEYFYSYKLPIAIIPPRKKRMLGLENDSIYQTTSAAIAALCSQALAAVEQGRPVLIGTQSIKDAIMVYDTFKYHFEELKQCAYSVQINLVTGNDSSHIASIYENGGKCGSVIIATQIAGRGVDIRLSDEARSNGGIALFGLDRALEARLDKQFLGRVGRQGDPFSAKFILSMEGNLFKKFSSQRFTLMIDKLKLDEDESIDYPIISRSIKAAQKVYRESEFSRRVVHDFINLTEKKIWLSYRNQLQQLNNARVFNDKFKKLRVNDKQNNLYYILEYSELSETYVKNLVLSFIDARLKNFIKDHMTIKQSEALVNETTKILPSANKNEMNPVFFEGKTAGYIRERLANIITKMIINKSIATKQQVEQFHYTTRAIDTYLYVIDRNNNNSYESANPILQDECDKLFEKLFSPIRDRASQDAMSIHIDKIEADENFLFFFKEHYLTISWNYYTEGVI